MTIEEAIGAMGVGEWGVGALILLFILSLVTGKLVPAKTLERLLAVYVKAYENERDARKELQKAVEKFAESGETTNHLLESIPKLEDVEAVEDTVDNSETYGNTPSRIKAVIDALRGRTQ